VVQITAPTERRVQEGGSHAGAASGRVDDHCCDPRRVVVDVVEVIAFDDRDRANAATVVEDTENRRQWAVLLTHVRAVEVDPVVVIERRKGVTVMLNLPLDDPLDEHAVSGQTTHLDLARRDSHAETLGFDPRRKT
jgi:hypothetical protein